MNENSAYPGTVPGMTLQPQWPAVGSTLGLRSGKTSAGRPQSYSVAGGIAIRDPWWFLMPDRKAGAPLE